MTEIPSHTSPFPVLLGFGTEKSGTLMILAVICGEARKMPCFLWSPHTSYWCWEQWIGTSLSTALFLSLSSWAVDWKVRKWISWKQGWCGGIGQLTNVAYKLRVAHLYLDTTWGQPTWGYGSAYCQSPIKFRLKCKAHWPSTWNQSHQCPICETSTGTVYEKLYYLIREEIRVQDSKYHPTVGRPFGIA